MCTSAFKVATRRFCFAPPRCKLMRCQLEPVVQGMLAITWAPGCRATSRRAASTVSRRRKSSSAV
eukprot:14298613-Heterocapsa_arctica.AAC.1